MKVTLRVLFFLLVIIGTYSCIEEIDLTVPRDLTDSIAIQGRISKGNPSDVRVTISNVFDFTTDSRNAIVVKEAFVVDQDGNRLELENTNIGTYERTILPDEMIVDFGRSYKIEVTTLDNRRFESSYDMLLPSPTPEKLELKTVKQLVVDNLDNYTEEDRIQLSVTSPVDITEDGGLLWEVENTFKMTDSPTDRRIEMKTCYITEDIGRTKINIIEPNQLAEGRVEDLPLFTTDVNYKFNEGIFFSVYQYSLSPEAYEYFRQVKTLTERTGNMFDDPVGEVTSNIVNINDPNDRVYGFFFATEGEVLRIKVPESLAGPLTPYCPPVVNNPPPTGCPFGICCDCLAEPKSTLQQPDYWE